jgi:hypothetical protein
MERYIVVFWMYYDGEFDTEIIYTFNTLEDCLAVIADEESTKDEYPSCTYKVKIYQEVV